MIFFASLGNLSTSKDVEKTKTHLESELITVKHNKGCLALLIIPNGVATLREIRK